MRWDDGETKVRKCGRGFRSLVVDISGKKEGEGRRPECMILRINNEWQQQKKGGRGSGVITCGGRGEGLVVETPLSKILVPPTPTIIVVVVAIVVVVVAAVVMVVVVVVVDTRDGR